MATSKGGRPRVLVADQIAQEGVAALEAGGLEPVLEHGPNERQLAKLMREVDAVIVRSATKIRAAAFGPKTKVSVIGRAGIGVDNIDVDAATEAGIAVLNTPDANAATTAELAVAHLFSLARKLTAADASVRAGKWEKARFTGTEIAGKAVGIIGYGTIGRIVANRCRGLGLRVMVHDPFVAETIVRDSGHEPVTMKRLLREADFVTVHAPGTKATMGLIGKAELKAMKKGAYLIQCARGGIVDEGALAAALTKGEIAGAAVDVFTTEPLPADHPLRDVPNITYTPHLGASTTEAQRATGVAIADQIVTFFATGEAVNAVNLPRVPADTLVEAKPYLPLAHGLGKLLGALKVDMGHLELVLRGHAADIPDTVLVAEALAGLLAHTLSVPVNRVNASHLAARQGIEVTVARRPSTDFATQLELAAHTGKHRRVVSGTLLGGAQPRITSFDGIELEAPLEGPVLLTKHHDRPGVVAELASLIAARRINISNMHVGSDNATKRAVAFIGLDKALPEPVLDAVAKFRFVETVVHLKF